MADAKITAGEIAVKLGMDLSSKNEGNIRKFSDALDNIGQKMENAFSKVSEGFKNFDSVWANIGKSLGALPTLINTFLGSAATVGYTNNVKLRKSYFYLFSEIKKYAHEAALSMSKSLNFTYEESLQHIMKAYKNLPARVFGSNKQKLDYATKIVEYSRRLEAADPHNRKAEELIPLLSKFVATKEGGEEIFKEISKEVVDPELLKEQMKILKTTEGEYFTEKAGQKMKIDFLDAFMAKFVPQYNAQEESFLRRLDRLEKRGKAIVEGIQNKLGPTIERVVKFLDRFGKHIGVSNEKLDDWISTAGKWILLMGGVIATLTALRTAFAITRLALFGFAGLGGGAGKAAGKAAGKGTGKIAGKAAGTGVAAGVAKRSPLLLAGKWGAALLGVWTLLDYFKVKAESGEDLNKIEEVLGVSGKKLDSIVNYIIELVKSGITSGEELLKAIDEKYPGIMDSIQKGADRVEKGTRELEKNIRTPVDKPFLGRGQGIGKDTGLQQASLMRDVGRGPGPMGGGGNIINFNQTNEIGIEVNESEHGEETSQKIAMAIEEHQLDKGRRMMADVDNMVVA